MNTATQSAQETEETVEALIAADNDILMLDEQSINALYVDSRNCNLAVNQFKNDKSQRSSDWNDWNDEDGGSFLDNSD